MERRLELEHPLGQIPPPPVPPPPTQPTRPLQAAQADFVLEIGCEELPPDDVASALDQLRCDMSRVMSSREIPLGQSGCLGDLLFCSWPRGYAPVDVASALDQLRCARKTFNLCPPGVCCVSDKISALKLLGRRGHRTD